MARQYFCWKVCLTFRCGCTEYTPTAHRCGPNREGCNGWLTYKRTEKDCEEHRLDGWGLSTSNNNNSSNNKNPAGSGIEGESCESGTFVESQPAWSEGEGYRQPPSQGWKGGEKQGGADACWEGYYTRQRA